MDKPRIYELWAITKNVVGLIRTPHIPVNQDTIIPVTIALYSHNYVDWACFAITNYVIYILYYMVLFVILKCLQMRCLRGLSHVATGIFSCPIPQILPYTFCL